MSLLQPAPYCPCNECNNRRQRLGLPLLTPEEAEAAYGKHAPGKHEPAGMIPGPKPGSAEWRKQRPLARGVLDYFPDALLEVAHCSWVGNEQHNPGQPLHWDRSKSTDEADALARHLKDRGTLDTDRVRHSAKVAWRALALLQKEIEDERANGKPDASDTVSP